MTATITLACDQLRNGQPCRGALPTRHRSPLAARREGAGKGWSTALVDLPDGAHAYVDTCPSRGHDEEPPR